ncbi:hypothetical protein ES288_A05G395600v1 [Gossypium darwinii]|uniref:Reverse transcriptase zinc-binding domain-containing protein n=1 Tax=Gossypium darwinii TaxID=34276 RepID=A0A5D2GPB3_GOSDA|nr:hypothetical protein ES288_A05G395600v1 [Gossypium darwinii]
MLDDEADVNFAFGRVWNIKVPPRVLSFLWMLAIDRIPSKEFLTKRGVNIQNFSISCPWCEGEPESASHLFFKCKFIKGFWAKIFNCLIWDVIVVWKKVDGVVDFFALYNNVKMAESKKSLWLISIEAACWTIWLARNGLVFYGRKVHMENLVFQSKMRALLWIRLVHNEIMMQENFWLKFNVCGISKEDKAGCGGVLRDMEGIARGIFSGAIDTNVAEEAEIGAVKIALEVFLTMNWKTNNSLFIKLGSLVVFSWCVNKFDWNGNDMAFSLALASVNRSQVFKAWW